jgi:hypothetical protein
VSYHGYGQVSFEASVSTSGGGSASTGPTGPKTALQMGPQCPPGYKPNASLMFTPTALLPPPSPLVPHCFVDKAAPAPAPAPAQRPYTVKPGILSTLFAPKPPAPVQTVLRSGAPMMPMQIIEDKPLWPWLLLGAVVLGGGGYYLYTRRQKSAPAGA